MFGRFFIEPGASLAWTPVNFFSLTRINKIPRGTWLCVDNMRKIIHNIYKEYKMAQTNINIRMDEILKAQAEKLFSELGMNMTSAFNVFVRQAVRQQKIPFEISAEKQPPAKKTAKKKDFMDGIVIPPGEENDPFWSRSNIKVLLESIKAADEGRLTEHELIEV
jgi:DNA-damage-inducible protein J